MQADQSTVVKTVLWSVIVSAIVILFVGIVAVSSVNSNLKLLNQKLEGFDVDETAIANAILAGIDMPEYDTEKVDELWEGVYDTQIGELENASFIESVYQFFDDNNYFEVIDPVDVDTVGEIEGVFNSLENLYEEGEGSGMFFGEKDDIFEFLEGEYEDIESVEFIKEYEGDREFNVINLGLDDEDDREVELSGVIKVLITYDDGNEEYKDKVYINSVVTSDDGELEAEVTYSL